MKKFLIWTLVLALLLALTGCGASDSAPAAPEEPTTEESAAGGPLPHEGAEPAEPAEPAPETAPEAPAEPEPTQPDPASAIVPGKIRVEEQLDYGAIGMTATLTATYEPTGETLWTYVTPTCVAAQLDTAELVAVYNDEIVYVNQQEYVDDAGNITGPGGLVALDLLTGEQLWINEDFDGCSVHYCFGSDGTLYIGGFFGPDCYAFDREGNTLWGVDYVNPDWFWPDEIMVDGDLISIHYTGGPEGDGDYYGYITTDGVVQ